MSGDAQYNVIFVLGGPGAGKGTQCEKIIKDYPFIHLSAGELLRQERNTEGSQYGELISSHIKNGSIVPVAITCSLLKREMESNTIKNFLIDGFPRNQDNLEGWNAAMSSVTNVHGVLFFNCADQVCVDRCLGRGASGSGRTDDNVESLKKRLATYRDSTMPIIDHFKGKDKVYEVNAAESPEAVFLNVQKILSSLGYKQ